MKQYDVEVLDTGVGWYTRIRMPKFPDDWTWIYLDEKRPNRSMAVYAAKVWIWKDKRIKAAVNNTWEAVDDDDIS